MLRSCCYSSFYGAFGLVLCAYCHDAVTALATLSLAVLAIWGALGAFWALPTAFLSSTVAAGSYVLIN